MAGTIYSGARQLRNYYFIIYFSTYTVYFPFPRPLIVIIMPNCSRMFNIPIAFVLLHFSIFSISSLSMIFSISSSVTILISSSAFDPVINFYFVASLITAIFSLITACRSSITAFSLSITAVMLFISIRFLNNENISV